MAVQDTDAPTPASQDFDRLACWLRLANTPGVGRHAAFRLLQHYRSPQAVFDAANARLAAPPARSDAEPPPGSLARRRAAPAGPDADVDADAGLLPRGWPSAEPAAGEAAPRQRHWSRLEDNDDGTPCEMPLAAARLLGGPMPDRIRALADATLAWAAQDGNHLLTLDDPAYPPTLQHIADPPLLLYAKGNPNLLQRDAVAVVGARNATLQGKSNARRFARALSEAGVAVVSGLALGIDAAAHEGGLEGPGRTVAIIGTGIDRIYPRRNAALARRIAEEGCLLSEFALGTQARAEHFPIRNRIIAGMTRATLVVEAAVRSGSLITAHAAVTAGREVFVLPGSVLAPQSVGCHALIREGARLVATPEHLLEDLGLPLPAAAAVAIDEAAGWLLAAIGHDPVGADELATRLQLPPSDMQASLLALELAGVVERLPGGAFQRLKSP